MPNTLHFEKISRFDRVEPIAAGIPFAPGELPAPAAFRLLDGGHPVPCQTTVTGAWPDGSVRWLFVRALVALPGNAAKTLTFRTDGGAEAAPGATVRVTAAADGLHVDTGRLAFTLPAVGIWPLRDVRLDGSPLWERDPFHGLRMQWGEQAHTTADLPVTLTVEEAGPLCAVIRLEAAPPADVARPAVRARLTCWAGQPWVTVQYTVTDRRGVAGEVLPVRDWALDLTPRGPAPRLRAGRGGYQDVVLRPAEEGAGVACHFTTELLRASGCEHQWDSFADNSWADWESARGGLQVAILHAAQNFPTGYVVAPDRLRAELYPAAEPAPLEWFAGTAKTHTLLLHFHPAGLPEVELSARALQFHIPDVPRVAMERYRDSGVWHELIFDGPTVRRVINTFATIADNRPVGLGPFNFGDEYDLGYTHQGRGSAGTAEGDRLVWLNNEYDVVHHFYLFAARTGLRRFRDYGVTGARHWMDVDIHHGEADPQLRGGHLAHTRRHAGSLCVTPSHQWVQGLFDTWHATGDPEAYAAAVGIAEQINASVDALGLLTPGHAQTRELGWALRALHAAWRETREPRYRDTAARIVAAFADWGQGGGALLAPYTSHSQVRVPFMNALTGVSLARWARDTGDAVARRVAVAVADDLLAHARQPWGLCYYKELPSLQYACAMTPVIELLAEVYRLTGDARYLEAGLAPLEEEIGLHMYHLGALRKHPMPNGIYTETYLQPHGGKYFAMALPAVLGFIAAADSDALAAGLDYRLRL